jgi:hypothetical protein
VSKGRRGDPCSFGKSDSKTSAQAVSNWLMFPGRCLTYATPQQQMGIAGISSSIEHGDKRKEFSVGSATPDWPYKCFQSMSEPIVDRVVRLMKDEELCE